MLRSAFGVWRLAFGVWRGGGWAWGAACRRMGIWLSAGSLSRFVSVLGKSRQSRGETANGRTGDGASGYICVPEGLNDRSQAIYCLELRRKRTRPVGTV